MSRIMELADAYAKAMMEFVSGPTKQDPDEARAALAAEIERVERDAARWKFVQENIYSLPYDDHGCGPEFDLSNEAIDVAMKEATNGQGN